MKAKNVGLFRDCVMMCVLSKNCVFCELVKSNLRQSPSSKSLAHILFSSQGQYIFRLLPKGEFRLIQLVQSQQGDNNIKQMRAHKTQALSADKWKPHDFWSDGASSSGNG